MVESSTIFLLVFFGGAIAATPLAVKWLADRNKGTNSEQQSYDNFKNTDFGKWAIDFRKPIDDKLAEYQKFVDKNNPKTLW